MTLPRPVLIAILGLALCAAAFLAIRSANDTGSAVTSVTPPTGAPSHIPVKPSKTAKHPAPAKTQAHKAAPERPTPGDKPDRVTPAAAKPLVNAAKPKATATPAKPAASPEVARTLPAIKALAAGKVVVFFFTQAGAADDTGAAIAVRALAHDKSVKVVTVGLK